MPKMGDAMEEGTLLEWSKKDGDQVKEGDIIGSIQTDKATLDLESPASGILTGFLIKAGDTVPVGRPIAAIISPGESLPADWGGGASKAQQVPQDSSQSDGPPDKEVVKDSSVPETPKIPDIYNSGVMRSIIDSMLGKERIKASPLAKRIAKENRIDLRQVKGTGPGGRIVERDVLELMDAKLAPQFASQQVVQGPVVSPGSQTRVPLNRLRQIIAQRTSQSKQQIPHFYVTVKVDIDKIIELRKMFDEEGSGRVSINDFVVKACALALRDMPKVNSSYSGNEMVLYGDINIGIAAAIDDGLLVPVIKNADKLTLRQIAAASKQLVTKAREGKLLPDEMSGSTFSISNMGMLDVDDFTAIINPPNVGIVAVSTAQREVVVVENDELEIRTRMNMTGSFDHRVLDGAEGAKFTNVVKSYLENPTRLID